MRKKQISSPTKVHKAELSGEQDLWDREMG